MKKLRSSSFLFRVAAFCAVISAAWPLSGGAQAMTDPTRPPASVFSPAPGNDGKTTSPLLQSVMISRSERSAIIGGEPVKQGGKYRDAQVISITETEVVLRSVHGVETLRLYPGIEMKPVQPAAAAVPKATRKPAARPTKTRGKQQ